MIGRFACPPCASLFDVEQWLWQKNKVFSNPRVRVSPQLYLFNFNFLLTIFFLSE